MSSNTQQLKWVDALKAFAIIAILMNHFVENFGLFPWFSNPSNNWPELSERFQLIIPNIDNVLAQMVVFAGWLGDMGPGVFIFLSGFTLVYSNILKKRKTIKLKSFYLKRYFRIFPLYFVIHILIILIAVLINMQDFDITSTKVFLSLTGFRFTESTFFFLNPSWWFIGLIFQMYLIFPFLYRMLLKLRLSHFIIITLAFTIVSRLLGLLDLTYANSLYYWMTGLFFGTRLFEFTIGMAIAKLFVEKANSKIFALSNTQILIYSLIIYITGFAASLFYFSTLISNILVTIGLSGLFLWIWKLFEKTNLSLQNAIILIGKISFPVYLLHQPLMIWAESIFPGIHKAFAMIIIIFLSFPIGYFIEAQVNKIVKWIEQKLSFFSTKSCLHLLLILIIIQLALNISYLYTNSFMLRNINIGLVIITLFFSALFLYFNFSSQQKTSFQIISVTLFSATLFTLVLTFHWFHVYCIYSLVIIAIVFILRLISRNYIFIVFGSIVISTSLFIGLELNLRNTKPLESVFWGERPALQSDSRTIYSLIPNKTTHLRYNNYDYTVKTNSHGFNSPEINLAHKDSDIYRIFVIGDAFSMPEGLPYKKAYPFLLEQKLQDKFPEKNIEVINGGVTGYGPNEMYAFCNKYIEIVKPDLIINQIFLNELEEVHILPEARLGSIGFYDMSYRGKLSLNCQVPVYVKMVMRKIRPKFQDDYNYAKSLAYLYEKKSYYYSKETIDKLELYFKNMKKLCKKYNSELLIMYVPGQLQISKPKHINFYPDKINLSDTSVFNLYLANRIFENICKKNEISFIDPSKSLKANIKQPLYFQESWHWNEEGHKAISTFLTINIRHLINKK
ncbi:MAG: acyltransferase family protein [Bacteroidota bacterium]|nr:acyltransferase family protein [Bacteroidota bacterium]